MAKFEIEITRTRTFEWAPSYGFYLSDARTPTDEEKDGMAHGLAKDMLIGCGNKLKLEHFCIDDLLSAFGGRKSTHAFCGTQSMVWVITADEEAFIMQIEQSRAAVAAEKQARCTAARAAAAEARDHALAESRRGIVANIIKHGHHKYDSEDPSVEPYAIVEITVDGGAPLRFSCRNVFDVGYVINPDYPIIPGGESGGIYNNGKWQQFDKGWYDVRDVTEEERRALNYLLLNPPISAWIRM